MNTKLTLRLDENVIERAKEYAQSQQISLSKLVENYLDSLTSKSPKPSYDIEITPLVKSLMGIAGPLPDDYDNKKEYRDYIGKKYQ
jgi:hypothetical protein